jgi:recombination protein RecT
MSTQAVVPAQGQEVAQRGGAQRSIKELLQGPELKNAIAAALPKHLKADRFIRVALTATMRQPDLLQCSRESFFRALLDLSALGIEADGRRAHLIPFRNNKTRQMEVQLIIDYKGIAELVRRSGDVSYIHADAVYPGDDFDYAYGSGSFLRHKPPVNGDRGKAPILFYSFVRLKDGTEDFIVMSKSDVDKIRARSKAKDAGPWVSDYEEMGKKTVFRRHSKWLPLSPESRDVVEHDDSVIDVDGALSAAVTNAGPERGVVSITDFSPSEDDNRGHNDSAIPKSTDPEPTTTATPKANTGRRANLLAQVNAAIMSTEGAEQSLASEGIDVTELERASEDDLTKALKILDEAK